MKEHIGDGAYAEWNGYELILTTENGISVQNRVVLEPLVLKSLKEFIQRVEASCKTT
tara:strand:- start:7613 stop:7783 length:171 start_codon:yes stop_codon:yes gene_type:complete